MVRGSPSVGDRISGRGLAAALAALLLTTLFVASPAASYTYPANTFGPTAVGLSCRDYVGGAGTGAAPTTYTGTFTLSQSPATPDIAQATTVTLAAANGPTAASTTAAGTYTVTATAALSGAIGGSVELATSTSVDNYPAAAVAAGNPLGPWTATGIYSPSLAGALQVAVNQIVFDDGKYGTGSGTNTDRYCSDPAASGTGSPLPANPNPKDNPVLSEVGYTATINGPVASVTAISGQRSGVTGFARPGETITVSGQDWPANETDFTAQLCTSGGATPCDAAAETLTANASGALSGTVAVPTGATVGVRGSAHQHRQFHRSGARHGPGSAGRFHVTGGGRGWHLCHRQRVQLRPAGQRRGSRLPGRRSHRRQRDVRPGDRRDGDPDPAPSPVRT